MTFDCVISNVNQLNRQVNYKPFSLSVFIKCVKVHVVRGEICTNSIRNICAINAMTNLEDLCKFSR